MAQTIKATHVPQDPIVGTRPTITHEIAVAEFPYDLDSVTQALVSLFRRFDLPGGGTIRVEGYGKALDWDYDGFLVPLARHLLAD